MEKKIISYVHSVDITSMSPSVNFVFYNALSIANQGQEINLYVRSGSNQPIESYLENRFDTKIPENLNIYTSKKRKFSLVFYLYCIISISKSNFDHLIITRSLGFLPYLITFKKKNWQLYFETHDFYSDLDLRDDINRKRKARKHKLEKLFLKKLDGIICLSNVQKKLFEKYYPDLNIKVFHTGLILQDSKASGKKQKYLVYVGSLDKLKGISNIFEVAQYLQDPITVKIVGGKTKNEINHIKSLIVQKKLDQKIEITGWLDKKELYQILKNAQAGLLPLENNFFNSYLTVPLKLLDYYAFSLPVFATNLPSLKEFIDDGKSGLLVDWEEPKLAAKQIESFLFDQDMMANAKGNIREKALTLKWEVRAQKHLELMNEIF
ncbi:MAG: glycosyltransferase [Bacteroidota bacterium]